MLRLPGTQEECGKPASRTLLNEEIAESFFKRLLERARPYMYIVLSPYHWQLLGALVCAIFAFIYFAVAQWIARPLNQSMGLVSFTFIALAFIVWLFVGFFIRRDSPPSMWQIGALFGAIFAFMLGCVLFGVSVAWTLFRMFRVHSSFR